MAFDGRVFRILIASPSDVEEEREIAVRVIQEWNDLNSYSRQVVLLPLRWETHAAPEYGVRPQEVINRAIVDECDLLIGVFWTRIGTPTGVADSGTLEEIERVAAAGKPAMLYFSKVGIDPDGLNLEQVARLKEFKAKTYPNALTENYKSLIEFRDKLARQIELKVRDLQKADSTGAPTVTLEFIDETSGLLGAELRRHLDIPNVTNLDAEMDRLGQKDTSEILKLVKNQIDSRSSVPIRLAINNSGSSGVRNLYVEVTVKLTSGKAYIADAIESSVAETLSSMWLFSLQDSGLGRESRRIEKKESNAWSFTFEWGAIQPRRVKLIEPPLRIRAETDCEFAITARVFADSFPQPVELQATLTIDIAKKDLPLDALFPQLERLIEGAKGKVGSDVGEAKGKAAVPTPETPETSEKADNKAVNRSRQSRTS